MPKLRLCCPTLCLPAAAARTMKEAQGQRHAEVAPSFFDVTCDLARENARIGIMQVFRVLEQLGNFRVTDKGNASPCRCESRAARPPR